MAKRLSGCIPLRQISKRGALGWYRMLNNSLYERTAFEWSRYAAPEPGCFTASEYVRSRIMKTYHTAAATHARRSLTSLESKIGATRNSSSRTGLPIISRHYPKTQMTKKRSLTHCGQSKLFVSHNWAGSATKRSFTTLVRNLPGGSGGSDGDGSGDSDDSDDDDDTSFDFHTLRLSLKQRQSAPKVDQPKQTPSRILPRPKEVPAPSYKLSRNSSLQQLVSQRSSCEQMWPRNMNGDTKHHGTYETQLKSMRISQPLKLKMPSTAEGDQVKFTHRVAADNAEIERRAPKKTDSSILSNRYRPGHNSKSPSLMNTNSTASMVMPVKAQAPKLEQKLQQIHEQHMEKENNKRFAGQRNVPKAQDKADIDYLLHDLMDKKEPASDTEDLKYERNAPLFKVVTTNPARRSNLYDRTFHKQLDMPKFFTSRLSTAKAATYKNSNHVFQSSVKVKRPANVTPSTSKTPEEITYKSVTDKLRFLLQQSEEDVE